MSTTIIRCTECGASLQHSIDRLIGVCSNCASRWFALAVLGTPSRDGYTEQDIRNEQNNEIESGLQRVPCEGCGDVYLMDDAPAGQWFCELCDLSAVS